LVGGNVTSTHHLEVVWEDGATAEGVQDALSLVGAAVGGSFRQTGFSTLEFDLSTTFAELDAALRVLALHPMVRVVNYDTLVEPAALPPPSGGPVDYDFSSSDVGSNWGHLFLHAPRAWDLNDALMAAQASDPSVRMPVGVFEHMREHPDLPGLTYERVNLATNALVSSLFEPVGSDHGLWIAGLVGADWYNQQHIVGVSPFARIRAIRPAPAGLSTASLTNQMLAILAATITAENLRVLNVSWAQPPACAVTHPPRPDPDELTVSICDPRTGSEELFIAWESSFRSPDTGYAVDSSLSAG